MKKVLLSALALALLAVALPVFVLLKAWISDGPAPKPVPVAGKADVSGLESSEPAEVVAVPADLAQATAQLQALLKRAAREKLAISISGARHSMGGHTLYPGGIALDMDKFSFMRLDEKARVLTVGSGTRWRDIIPFLDKAGLAVAVMQSNNDFSVGGSISVNCHGWQNDTPPIASTVRAFRLLTADGKVRNCSRSENAELFRLALGGYGLFGVILDVDLEVVPNEAYVAEVHRVPSKDYARVYRELCSGRQDVGMAYGRVNIAPHGFLDQAIITLLKRPAGKPVPAASPSTAVPASALRRTIFLASIGSGFGKDLRWWLENAVGETAGRKLWRNQIMNEAGWVYTSRDVNASDILHEYFIPAARFGEFIEKSKPVFLKHRPDLLNITVRNVMPDQDAYLRYATEEVFGLVMLFHYPRTAGADAQMAGFTRELIDVALACGGRYYLPYRPHATPAQFLAAYPQAPAFFALKKKYDPQGLFQNQFYKNYGLPKP